jgi:HD-GYP domain-containing protein (c-di-GMP phosphodiesterase class II)
VLLLPAVAATLAVTSVIAIGSHEDASRTRHVSSEVKTLAKLVVLREALEFEQALKAFDVRFDQLGSTATVASGLIGVDLVAAHGSSRTKTLDAIAAAGRESPVNADELTATPLEAESGSAANVAAASRLAELTDIVHSAVVDMLDDLDNEAWSMTLRLELETLRATLAIGRSASAQGIVLSELMFPAPTMDTRAKAAALARLAAETADYTTSTKRARATGPPTFVAQLDAVESDRGSRPLYRAIGAAVSGQSVEQPEQTPDLDETGAIFRGYLDRSASLTALASFAAADARTRADDEAATSNERFRLAVAGSLSLLLLATASVLFVTRIIASPVRDLAAFARALDLGHLDTPPPRSRRFAPRETIIAVHVVAGLAATLRLIEAKTNAFAAGDLQAPVLDEPLRGPLGNSIQQSVARLTSSIEERDAAWRESMRRLARAVDLRDDETGGHIVRVARYSALIATELGLTSDECELIGQAVPMHDIGKIAVPDDILLKPGKLTANERTIIERHCEAGHALLSGTGSKLFDLAATIAWTHHERFDGTGYPRGIAYLDIPLAGRITAVADVFDALTSPRPYRRAMSIEQAIEIMHAERDSHFDPAVFDAFMLRIDDITELHAGHAIAASWRTAAPTLAAV